MTAINLEPLRETFRRINADPASYNQMCWGKADQDPAQAPACKTAFCIAGHLAVSDGWKPLWEQEQVYDPILGKRVDRYFFESVEKDGETHHVETVAAGLVADWENRSARDAVIEMFAAENEPADIQDYAERLARWAGEDEMGVVLLPGHWSHNPAE